MASVENLRHYKDFLPPVVHEQLDLLVYSLFEYKLQVINVALVIFVLYYMVQRRRPAPGRQEAPLTEKEINQLCAEWEPVPLVITPKNKQTLDSTVPVVFGPPAPELEVEGKGTCLNLATRNYLGLVGNKKISEAVHAAVHKYGVGSCGPRGFYGTIDTHLDLEKHLARFYGATDGIVFSSGYATMSSIIPVFSSRGDLIIADSGVHHAIKTGLNLSRSTVFLYKHNDMADLERIMQKVVAEDVGSKKPLNRRFLVVEGVYFNTGDLAPLDEIIRLKEKYCFRLMLDDTNAFGVLGKTGRGSPEHFGIDPSRVEMISADLSTSLGSVGGFCVGSYAITYHQRINSSGYVFSASAPPYLMKCADVALSELEEHPELLVQLKKNISILRTTLKKVPELVVGGSDVSPVIHVKLAKPLPTRLENEKALQKIVEAGLDNGVATTRAMYDSQEPYLPEATIRLTVTAGHSAAQVEEAAARFIKSVRSVVPSLSH